MPIRQRTQLADAVFLSLAIAIPAALAEGRELPAAVANGAGRCASLVSEYKIASSAFTTSAPLQVPGTSLSFVQGGGAAGCVTVSFSAEARADQDTVMVVAAVLDDTVPCLLNGPYFVRSNASATDFAARTMNYVCPDVAPGRHTIHMQAGSELGGNVWLLSRTTIVSYVP